MSVRGWLAPLTVLALLAASESAQAGIVLVSQGMDGVLTIIGSGDNDNISVVGGARRVTVLALGSSRFPSTGRRDRRVLTFADVTGVVFQGLGGHDTLTVNIPAETLDFQGGEGDDQLVADVGPATLVNVNCGAGHDTVILSADGAETVTVDLGDGDDGFTMTSSAVGALTLTDGGGNDEILFNNVTGLPEIGIALSVSCGAGDDQVAISNCDFTSSDPMTPVLFNGGDNSEEGMDQIAQAGSMFEPPAMIEEFEVVIGFDPPPPPPEPLRFRRR